MSFSLLALQPDYAESIIDFRYRQLGAAIENSKEYDRLAQEPDSYLRKYNYSSNSALYPWTAGRFGNATGIGPAYDYEMHLNSDIALLVHDYYAQTQNKTWLEEKGWPIIEAVSNMFATFVQYDNTTGMYSTYNETSPE